MEKLKAIQNLRTSNVSDAGYLIDTEAERGEMIQLPTTF
jgi:hypothetical protein